MDLKLDYGPWKTAYAGKFQGRDVEIVVNPENLFLVFIYETSEDGAKIGALIEGYKAFLAKGRMESFIETLPKPALGITKSVGNKTAKVLFLSFDPIYLDFKHEDFLRKIDLAMKRLFDSVGTLADLARASSLELKELNMSPASEYSIILGDPFTMRALIGGPTMDVPVKAGAKAHPQSESGGNAIQLGLSKEREIITEKTGNLKRTIIISQTKKEHEYAQYIITENFLLENKPMIVFDDEDYFSGLKTPSQNEKELRDSLVSYDPIGFPTKNLKVKEGVKISIKDIDFGLMTKLLRISDDEFNTKLTLAKAPIQVTIPEDLAKELLNSTQLSDYEKLRAERIVMIMSQQFPNMFGESADIAEITKDWPGNLGRATILNMKELSEQEKVLFVQTMLRRFSRKIEATQGIGFSIVIPNADKVLSLLPDKVEGTVLDLENKGVGFIFGVTRKGFNPSLEKSIGANITVVSGNDLAVSVANERNYRVKLRPSLSGNATYN